MSEKRDHRQTKDNTKNSSAVFADYASYYDLLYHDKDYAAEAEYVAGLVRNCRPSTQSILELGSGTGIHASLLAEKGFNVHGIERSREMLARSLALAEKMTPGHGQLAFSPGDIRDIRLNKRFDAVISLFHVISYQTTSEDVTAAFETAKRHLKPGGIFIFDVWYGPAVLTQRPEVRIKRIMDDQNEITRLAEPMLHENENLVDVQYDVFVRDLGTNVVKELKETHLMRYFFKPEIDSLATLSGFTVQNVEEWYSAKPISTSTWSVCFCLRSA